jgi:hypothetical protein
MATAHRFYKSLLEASRNCSHSNGNVITPIASKSFDNSEFYRMQSLAQIDSCRVARHTLSLIATARPDTLLNALCMEVARYNVASQSQASAQHAITSPLSKSSVEVLRLIELISDKYSTLISDSITQVGGYIIFFLDQKIYFRWETF